MAWTAAARAAAAQKRKIGSKAKRTYQHSLVGNKVNVTKRYVVSVRKNGARVTKPITAHVLTARPSSNTYKRIKRR